MTLKELLHKQSDYTNALSVVEYMEAENEIEESIIEFVESIKDAIHSIRNLIPL